MARRKKKKHHEEHVDEAWLLPYADLLTLLLALFIVLFAASSVDMQKFQKLASSFNSVFTGGNGLLEYQTPLPQPVEVIETSEEDSDKEAEKEKLAERKEQEELHDLQGKIDEYIKDKGLNLALKTRLTDEGLLVTLLNDAFFNSGSADVRKEDVELATEISELLVMNPPRDIIVSGHTDNVPIRNSQFDDNWHLSVMRSINFMKILLENKQLDPKLFSAKGFGEYEPVATNNDENGRRKNRRVEILILPNE